VQGDLLNWIKSEAAAAATPQAAAVQEEEVTPDGASAASEGTAFTRSASTSQREDRVLPILGAYYSALGNSRVFATPD
jgi:hypothetical protein